MASKTLRYVYGPVSSWRLGVSLGIDPLGTRRKQCSFDCRYCQLGPTKAYALRRRVYVKTADIAGELARVADVRVDAITFAGNGEPTLAKNLGQIIRAIKKMRAEPVVVITNAALFSRAAVRRAAALADEVIAKLDAPTPEMLQAVNHPAAEITFARLLRGLRLFRAEYRGKFSVQLMFVAANRAAAPALADLCRQLRPDEVQLNTPLRQCACRPLPPAELSRLRKYFQGMRTRLVYEGRRTPVRPFDEAQTARRHGKTVWPKRR
ncbi:MAG: radical SAM protein [Candidatus Omnitrophica bacterium]|nr:radical SAM protein [Candidatus Omnitrophota bacterium]